MALAMVIFGATRGTLIRIKLAADAVVGHALALGPFIRLERVASADVLRRAAGGRRAAMALAMVTFGATRGTLISVKLAADAVVGRALAILSLVRLDRMANTRVPRRAAL